MNIGKSMKGVLRVQNTKPSSDFRISRLIRIVQIKQHIQLYCQWNQIRRTQRGARFRQHACEISYVSLGNRISHRGDKNCYMSHLFTW